MNIVQRARFLMFGDLPATKARASAVRDPLLYALISSMGRQAVWSKQDFQTLVKEGYEKCMTVYACVSKIASAAAGIQFRLTDGADKGIDNHPLLDLLWRPNEFAGQRAWMRTRFSQLLLHGNSYVQAVRPSRSMPPAALYLPMPQRIKIVPGSGGQRIGRYEYEVNGVKTPIEPELVLHSRLFHPTDDWYGLSPLTVASRGVDASNMAAEWNMRLLQNDMRPPGVYTTETSLSEAQYERLKAGLKEKYDGYDNAGNSLLLEGGVKWTPTAIPPREMDWLQSTIHNKREIAAVFNIAPELIGDGENKTYSNFQEARRALYTEAVLPLMDEFVDDLNTWLCPMFGDSLWLSVDRNQVEALQEDREKKFAYIGASEFMRMDEKRGALGMDPLGPKAGGDLVLVPAGKMPLDSIVPDTSPRAAKGGSGSGHFGHDGRPGLVWGSMPGSGTGGKRGDFGGAPFSERADNDFYHGGALDPETHVQEKGALYFTADEDFAAGYAEGEADLYKIRIDTDGALYLTEQSAGEIAGDIWARYEDGNLGNYEGLRDYCGRIEAEGLGINALRDGINVREIENESIFDDSEFQSFLAVERGVTVVLTANNDGILLDGDRIVEWQSRADADQRGKTARPLPLPRKSWSTPERKEALWNNFVRRVETKERALISIAYKYLIDQAARVSKACVVNVKAEALAFQKIVLPWAYQAAQRAAAAGIQAAKGELPGLETKVDLRDLTPTQRAYLEDLILRSGTQIAETTMALVRDVLVIAEAEDWTTEELTQRLIDKLKSFAQWRCRTIARTESAKVENWGQVEGYKNTEFVARKGWLCEFVPDSRDAHIAADGQEVGVTEDFHVDGQAMAYPGDPRGGAGNVVNCLCSTYPIVD